MTAVRQHVSLNVSTNVSKGSKAQLRRVTWPTQIIAVSDSPVTGPAKAASYFQTNSGLNSTSALLSRDVYATG